MYYINSIDNSNPIKSYYKNKIDVILFAHQLIGTVRGKSANGIMMHSNLFNVLAIVDEFAVGKSTKKVCSGVSIDIPIYNSIQSAILSHKAKAIILLNDPNKADLIDIQSALLEKLDLINTHFSYISNIPKLVKMIRNQNCKYFDLRDVSDQKAHPNTEILNRRAKVIYSTGTDCGLGKRTAAFELAEEAKKRGIKATMYATGQTGLMLGENGTVFDSLIIEFSNGVVSQHITELSNQGYEMIFVEGQADIFHPANSAVSMALLHGANPDCLIIVHDESRKQHKGFEEDSPLYKMHSLQRHIDTLKMLSLPCGPEYNTVGIATIGKDNIANIKNILKNKNLAVADVRQAGGPAILLDSILNYFQDSEKANVVSQHQLN